MVALLTVLRVANAQSTSPEPPRVEQNDEWRYNSDYIYGMSRGLNADRDFGPGAKLTLMPLTLVLDTVLLPIGAIAGLLGQPPSRSHR